MRLKLCRLWQSLAWGQGQGDPWLLLAPPKSPKTPKDVKWGSVLKTKARSAWSPAPMYPNHFQKEACLACSILKSPLKATHSFATDQETCPPPALCPHIPDSLLFQQWYLLKDCPLPLVLFTLPPHQDCPPSSILLSVPQDSLRLTITITGTVLSALYKISCFNLQITLQISRSSYYSILQLRKLRPKEVMQLAQGHAVSGCILLSCADITMGFNSRKL